MGSRGINLMTKQPAFFVSHGSPMMVLEDSPARSFLTEWGDHHDKPKAILVVSAHWENIGGPAVSLAQQNETIHDFCGFPRELYEIKYDTSGSPEVARLAFDLLKKEGFAVQAKVNRGLDHGAWVPLKLMYPDADIPAFQISLIHEAGPSEHYRLGLALQSMREQGVLIIGSGSLTHNLNEIMGHRIDDPVPLWVSDFENWIAQKLGNGKLSDVPISEDLIADLLNYRSLAPHAKLNHPTEEHLLPLFVALGVAGAGAAAFRVHASHTYGVLAMDAYTFTECTQQRTD